jgi:hypothetical protein
MAVSTRLPLVVQSSSLRVGLRIGRLLTGDWAGSKGIAGTLRRAEYKCGGESRLVASHIWNGAEGGARKPSKARQHPLSERHALRRTRAHLSYGD